MLLALRENDLGFRFGLVPGARASNWAYLFFGLGEWACAPIFQTLSDMDSSDVVSSDVTLSLMLQLVFYYVMQHAESCHETSAIVV